MADFTGRNVSAADAAIVSDMLRTELVKSGRAHVVDRANMDKLLAEAGFQRTSGCTEAECAAEMGRILNVRRMVVGTVARFEGVYIVTADLVVVETSHIIRSERGTTRTVASLVDVCRTIALELVK